MSAVFAPHTHWAFTPAYRLSQGRRKGSLHRKNDIAMQGASFFDLDQHTFLEEGISTEKTP